MEFNDMNDNCTSRDAVFYTVLGLIIVILVSVSSLITYKMERDWDNARPPFMERELLDCNLNAMSYMEWMSMKYDEGSEYQNQLNRRRRNYCSIENLWSLFYYNFRSLEVMGPATPPIMFLLASLHPPMCFSSKWKVLQASKEMIYLSLPSNLSSLTAWMPLSGDYSHCDDGSNVGFYEHTRDEPFSDFDCREIAFDYPEWEQFGPVLCQNEVFLL